jgi:hypothetical protein
MCKNYVGLCRREEVGGQDDRESKSRSQVGRLFLCFSVDRQKGALNHTRPLQRASACPSSHFRSSHSLNVYLSLAGIILVHCA